MWGKKKKKKEDPNLFEDAESPPHQRSVGCHLGLDNPHQRRKWTSPVTLYHPCYMRLRGDSGSGTASTVTFRRRMRHFDLGVQYY